MHDGDGAAGRDGRAGRGPTQERGRPRLRASPAAGSISWCSASSPRASRAGAALTPPARQPGRTPSEIEDEIVALRKDLTDDGHEAGAATIAAHLARRAGETAACRRCRRSGGSCPPRIRHPATPQTPEEASCKRFDADAPNERWQLDITHWRLADGTEVEILNIIDDHSRLLVGSTARRVFTAADVDTAFTAATSLRRPGRPADRQRGGVHRRPRRGGRVALELTRHARGIRFTHSRPYHPQTCGKVERFHQTLKKWLDRPTAGRSTSPAAGPARPIPRLLQHHPTTPRPRPAHTRPGLRRPPESRPHRHPDRRPATTASATTASTPRRHHPAPQQPPAPHRDRPPPRRHPRPGPGPRPPHPRHQRHDGELLRELTLDPTRDYQPQAPTVNDVPRHLCTVSRDITRCAPGRIRTCDLGIRSPPLCPD